jgi:hypothetical protein
MKVRFALVAMTLIAVAPLSAQRRGGRGGGAMNIDRLTTTYTLTGDQKSKTEALIKTYTDATEATQMWLASERAAGANVNADSAKKIADARTTFSTSFKALLTAPQSEKYDSIQKVMASRTRGGGA